MPTAFNRLLVAWFASLTGDGMRFAALPLLALTLVPSPAAVSAVAAATALPWLLVALPAGALVDRLDPATVIAWANAGRALTTGSLVVAILAHRADIPLLCLVGFALTTAETFADGAAQTLLVRIVPSERLEKANARFVSSENIGLDLLGPLAAGALFTADRWLPFAVAATVFAATAVGVLGLRGRRVASGGIVGSTQGASVPGLSVRDAFRFVLSSADLRALVITVAVMAAAIAAAEGVLVLYSTTSLSLPAVLYPTLLACYSIGVVIAAAAVSRWGPPKRTGTVMLTAVVVIGTTLLLLGLFPAAVIGWSCFLLMGAAGGVWNVLSATRRQRQTPPSMVARVSSTFRAISWGALPLGTALGGLIGQEWSVPTVFVIAGLVILTLAAAMGHSLRCADSDAGTGPDHLDRETAANLPRAPGSI